MISLIASLALAALQPEPNSDEAYRQFCTEMSAGEVAAGRPAISCEDGPAELSGPATLELCLTEPGAGRHPDCRPLLEPEAALVPDALFNSAIETPPARRDGWLGVVCAADRLAQGQTVEACRADGEARLERARRARVALVGRNDEPFNGFSLADMTDIDFGSEPAPREPRWTPPEERPERCRRREEVRRDPDTGESSSSYSVTCSVTTGSPENEARARELMDDLLWGD